MTEAEWLASNDPREMIFHQLIAGPKLRLFAVACCRRLTHLLHDQRSIKLLDAIERYANGKCTRNELATASEHAAAAVEEIKERIEPDPETGRRVSPELSAANIVVDASDDDAATAAEYACYGVAFVMSGGHEEGSAPHTKELGTMLDLLRKIVGKPVFAKT